jgi:3D (Asp-Asp-Asp) domain-containing protein
VQKATVKSSYGIFQSPKSIFALIGLTAVICVLICIVRTAYAKANGRTSLFSVIVTEINTDGGLVLNGSEVKAVLKPSELSSTVDNPRQPDKWQTVRMRVTAYCPCRKCCGKYSDGQTACGHKICPGDVFVAADEEYSFGTEMLIAGYNDGKPVKVLDRGGAVHGDRLDVFFHSHEEALEWGVRYVDVEVCSK